MVGAFEIIGPSNNPYPGAFCLPQVPLQEGVALQVGDEATIQVIETLEEGGALYNVSFYPGHSPGARRGPKPGADDMSSA